MAFTERLQLADLRLRQNWTYDELGRRLLVSGPAVHKLLNDPRAEPNDRTLYRIRKLIEKYPAETSAAQ